jgi:hypothetical protein
VIPVQPPGRAAPQHCNCNLHYFHYESLFIIPSAIFKSLLPVLPSKLLLQSEMRAGIDGYIAFLTANLEPAMRLIKSYAAPA